MFGTVEAQFSPEAVPANEEAENFPTRSEINAVRKENAELKATVEALREEAGALRMARPMEAGDKALAVPKEEFDKVVVERETLKEERLKQDEEIARLKTDLAVLKRDRVNLQLAYDGLQREITDLRAKAGGVEEIALPPKAAAAALAAQAPAPGQEVRVEVPVPAAKTTPISLPKTVPAAPAAPAAPEPAEPPAEQKPQRQAVPPDMMDSPPIFTRIPTAKPAAPKPTGPIKPFAPLPKATATATVKPFGAQPMPTVGTKPVAAAPPPPAAEAPKPAEAEPPVPAAAPKPAVPKAPMGLGGGGGMRPAPKPAVPLGKAPSEEDVPDDLAETARLTPPRQPAATPPRPAPSVKLPLAPTVKLPPTPAPAPKAGPKGTQKLS